jgi:hypothetical protein
MDKTLEYIDKSNISFSEEQLKLLEKILKEELTELAEDIKKQTIPKVYIEKQLELLKEKYNIETNPSRKLFIEGGIFNLKFLLKED